MTSLTLAPLIFPQHLFLFHLPILEPYFVTSLLLPAPKKVGPKCSSYFASSLHNLCLVTSLIYLNEYMLNGHHLAL